MNQNEDEALSYARSLIGDGKSGHDYTGALAQIEKRLNTKCEPHEFLQRAHEHVRRLQDLHLRHG